VSVLLLPVVRSTDAALSVNACNFLGSVQTCAKELPVCYVSICCARCSHVILSSGHQGKFLAMSVLLLFIWCCFSTPSLLIGC